ncbi:MAG: lipoate--protein ligase family protein [Candidatus Entotheonellia bacterium]
MSAETPPRWRLLQTGPGDGFTNMAVDEALLDACIAGSAPPALRFYTWSPPAISIGYGQQFGSSIDLDRCRALGIDVVRRPTGGLAVLHQYDVSYSLVLREDELPAVRGILASYLTVSHALIRGLSYLGVKAELLPLRRAPLPSEQASPLCFVTPSSYEVAVQGRKLIGSAQRRVHGVILQHGSLPLSLDLAKLCAVLPPATHGSVPGAAEAEVYRSQMTSLQEAGGRMYSDAEVIAALSRGFAEVWEVELTEGHLTAEERRASARLLRDKYHGAAGENRA